MSPRSKESHKKSTVAHNAPEVRGPAEQLETMVPEARRSLSELEQSALLRLPVHDVEARKAYLKPHEGFERVAPLTLKRLGSYPDIASALRLELKSLAADLVQASVLAEQEDIAFRLHRRALENRLSIESEAYRSLLKLNRFLQSSDDGELQRDFADLAEWVAARTEGSRRREPGGAGEPAQPEPKPE